MQKTVQENGLKDEAEMGGWVAKEVQMELQENGLKDDTEMGERGWTNGCKRQCRKMARKTKSKQEK